MICDLELRTVTSQQSLIVLSLIISLITSCGVEEVILFFILVTFSGKTISFRRTEIARIGTARVETDSANMDWSTD